MADLSLKIHKFGLKYQDVVNKSHKKNKIKPRHKACLFPLKKKILNLRQMKCFGDLVPAGTRNKTDTPPSEMIW